jgi:HPt (histidine-containing phosphotransfer) domain-containing protein
MVVTETEMAEAFVLDRASILERLGGDEEIYTMMVDMFLDDVENNCTALAAALSSGDVKSLQREAHTIKGLLATFSDEAGAAEALVVEKTAKEGELDSLVDAVNDLQARLREVAKVLGAR